MCLRVFFGFFFKYFQTTLKNNDSLEISSSEFDIIKPKFSINSESQKIAVTANEGNFISENKILLIYNHGQSSHDGPSSDCVWKGGMKNMASLVGQKVDDKEILVYIFCTGKLKGDDYKKLWNKKKFKPPYKGKPKLEKRLDANLKLIDNFVSQGFKKNQIFSPKISKIFRF